MRLASGTGIAAVLLTGAAIGVSGASGASSSPRATRGSHAPGAACVGRAARRLRLKRLAGTRARLSWSAPSASASRAVVYRILRSGRTVGQTRASSIVLRITPGRATTYTVQARAAGSPGVCSVQLKATLAWRAPGRVGKLRIVLRSATGVIIAWRAAARGDAPVGGYRIYRDDAVAGQTRALRYALRLSSGRSHRVTVTAVDTRGHLGAPSKALVIAAAPHAGAAGAPPSTPGGLSASNVGETGATIWWVASRPGGARIVGYRVYREGQLVGQSAGTTMRLEHLAFPHTYSITVSAIDAAQHESPRAGPLKLTTTHIPPNAPSLFSAVRVTDTSATLSWQAGSANGGTVAGYLLFQDGAPVGVVHGQITTVALASERRYAFTVRTLDSAGYLSEPAPELTVLTTHTPPPAPTGLAAVQVTSQSATVRWSPSTAVSGTIVGYRVFRNEIPVGQTAASEATLAHLAPSSEYQVTVSAVDSLGAASQPAAPLAIHTAEPPATHGNVQAYLLASTGQSFVDLQAHYQQIGVVYPTYFSCGADGEVLGADDPLVTRWALARKIEVLPRVNCQNVADEEQILGEPAARETMIGQLASLCQKYGYSGVQIDFEGAPPSERNPFTAFVTALAARLHSQGDKLSTVVTAKYYNVPTGRAAMYDDAALSGPSDYVFVLDWGLHWLTSAPGSIDEMPWFKRVAEYTATMPNRSKFVLGMPLYGIDWPNGGGSQNPGTALEFSEILALEHELGVVPEWEATAQSPHFSYTDGSGVHHEVWYVDQQSLAARAGLASSLGLKIGLWRLGTEDQSIWELPLLGGEG
ncbi:MAG: fibronectin type III domain-containing protein [Solirubrobacteraceae bacterium]